MNEKTLIFGNPENITRPGDDGIVYRFPFSVVDSDLIGSPEEAQVTTRHSLTVRASRSRLGAWSLSDSDLQRVLFEIGKRELTERAARDALKADEIVNVNTVTHCASVPFDPSRIADPSGQVVRVERVPRGVSF